ncbi:universal stress protein [Phragmitibacter flavus]|uniref:Universal stress protein n=1 Tax=Phragmitibacter flavus TaxID=2576071 RepID=A0A5R8K9K5_9BACT|nr:universal stress protein [Phragmitibacter flavus]TLD68984.1 universal stress protein [Phragmitibacter flavus]
MKTIVTLVDFSDVAFKVLKHAHDLALAFDSQVILLHVVPQEPVVVGFGIAPTIMSAPSEDLIAVDTERLTEMQESLAKFGVKATTRQLQGATIDSVLDECEKLGAELIIVGSHKHGPLYNLFVGSITADILKRTHCPVLVVPHDVDTQ